MIPGYNHNIRYRDQIFHVQTEDSGVDNPHIITHLFVGGNIVETRKTSYADIVHSERLNEMLVDLMQEQHKGMLRDLIKGRVDDRIDQRSSNAGQLDGPAPLNVGKGQGKESFGFGGVAKPQPEGPKAQPQQAPSTAPPSAEPPQAPAPIKAPAPPQPPTPPSTPQPPTPPSAPQPPTPPSAPAQPPSQPETPAAAAPPPAAADNAGTPPAQEAAQVKAEKTESGELVIEAEALERAFESKDESAVDSIFGEDLISEKSLDEVILSYLADDLKTD